MKVKVTAELDAVTSEEAKDVLCKYSQLTKSERIKMLKLIDNSYDARWVISKCPQLTEPEREMLQKI